MNVRNMKDLGENLPRYIILKGKGSYLVTSTRRRHLSFYFLDKKNSFKLKHQNS